jgi:hypothetical protein
VTESEPLSTSAGQRAVVEWIPYEDAVDKEETVGGLGGWFDGHTWEDYINQAVPVEWPYLEAIKSDVLRTGRFICGNQHQDDPNGVPLFDDGTVGMFSFRGWGDLMAAIATAQDGKSHNYMEFYYD